MLRTLVSRYVAILVRLNRRSLESRGRRFDRAKTKRELINPSLPFVSIASCRKLESTFECAISERLSKRSWSPTRSPLERILSEVRFVSFPSPSFRSDAPDFPFLPSFLRWVFPSSQVHLEPERALDKSLRDPRWEVSADCEESG